MSRREKLRQIMLDDIKQVARQQMAENGTATISLSAIARALEVSQPALYRYYPSRDDLITALILDAYNDLADTEAAADSSQPSEYYGRRLMAVILAIREWAVAHPLDFQLIYGNPIPGYHAPEAETMPAARRGFAVILRILYQALLAGALKPRPSDLEQAARMSTRLQVEENGQAIDLPQVVLYIGVAGWYQTNGLIMLELFNHTRALIADPGAFYQAEMENLLNSLGLET
jgi:AcrR family transcriptional regulator